MTLDPRTHAVRSDLADVRLAEQVFAPHYAAAMPRCLKTDAKLLAEAQAGADVIATLQSGSTMEVLDIAGRYAWGIVPHLGLVGYVDAAAIDGLAV